MIYIEQNHCHDVWKIVLRARQCGEAERGAAPAEGNDTQERREREGLTDATFYISLLLYYTLGFSTIFLVLTHQFMPVKTFFMVK